MKRLFLLILVCVLLVPGIVRAQNNLSEAERRWLAEREEIIFVGQISYPPFEFIHPRYGEYTGMAIDLIRWIATEYGFNVVFRPMPFAAAQQAVTLGTADALTGIFESEERRRRFDFTTEVFSVPASIFVHSERTDIIDLEDLEHKRIAVQRGDYAIEFFANLDIPVSWVYTSDFQSALNLVASRQADAMIGDEQVVLYHIFTGGLTDIVKKVAEPLYIGSDCMAVAKGNTLLLSILQKGLNRAQSTGVLDTIYQKWLGVSYGGQSRRVDRWRMALFIVLGGLSLVSLGALGWTFQLRHLVRRKTAELQELNINLRHSNESLTYANSQLLKDMEERTRLAEESRRLEARMIRTQSNESLALMAGNIAHDFNNLLMGIIGSIELVLISTDKNQFAPETVDTLQAATRNAKRAGELARRMLEFSGQRSINRNDLDLVGMVKDIQALLESATGTSVALHLDLAAQPIRVKGDPAQLKQVCLNLLLNAYEAGTATPGQSSGGGQALSLCIRKQALGAEQKSKIRAGLDLSPGTYAWIEVVDQGQGIGGQQLERIFEPYYSTKKTGRGLGLAATAGIVKAHGGAILVDSQPGGGSRFSVLLPLAEDSDQA